MQVAEFVINYLASLKVKHVFLITGSAIAFTVDKFSGRRDIAYICMHHEQAAAMAADAYSRLGPNLGVTMATSGPGATNLITGICCSWFDSIPTLHITGQVNTNEQIGKSKVRQIGFQEAQIVDIVKPISKFAAILKRPGDIKFLLEKAVYLAQSGRPGPVLLDIPINLQYAQLPPRTLKSFIPPKTENLIKQGVKLRQKIQKIAKLIEKAKRPVILAGFGNRLAGAKEELTTFAKLLNFPVVTTWSGLDLLAANHPLLVGQSGVYGSRAANWAIQNSDLLIAVGARLETRQTGAKPQNYAREAKKIVIDIDPGELKKKRGLTPDIAINADAKLFLSEINQIIPQIKIPDVTNWRKIITRWKEKYPIVKPEYYQQKKFVNPYVFIKTLSELLPENAVIIADEGGNLTWTVQSFEIKEGQRFFSAFGNSPMGYALPASIGAAFAFGNLRPLICITGDGGLHINIQEFQTIVYHKLPIKIFVLNNKCYGIIKQFQDTWLGSRYEASERGYQPPDFIKVAKAYGFEALTIDNHQKLPEKIGQVLNYPGPLLCDVLLDPDQKIMPKIEFGMPLEDMTPYLERSEFLKNIIVKPLPESLNLKIKS